MADFVADLDRINALADTAPGFVWRLQTDDGDATALRPLGDDILVNLTVWRDLATLRNYVYGPAHVNVMRRRREWFARMATSHLVMWWIRAGHRPDLDEAHANLDRIRDEGATAAAFDFRRSFPAPDA